MTARSCRYQFPAWDDANLIIPIGAHTPLARNLPSCLTAKILGVGGEDVPIVYCGATYFPLSFQIKEFNQAFIDINDNKGWMIARRDQKVVLVGESNNGRFKVQMALNFYSESPTLISAYPVSRKDRHLQIDFLRFDNGGNLVHNGILHLLAGLGRRSPMVLQEIAKAFIASTNDKKVLSCRGFCKDSSKHNADCPISQMQSQWRDPEYLKWRDEKYYHYWRYNSIELGAPWYFVLDHEKSMTLVLQCCNRHPYAELYSIPWDAHRERKLRKLTKKATMYFTEQEKKVEKLDSIARKIWREGRQRDSNKLVRKSRGSLEVIGFGRNPQEEFLILHPARYIGYRFKPPPSDGQSADGFMRYGDFFVGYNAEMDDSIRELSAEVRAYNQAKTDIDGAQWEQITSGACMGVQEVGPGVYHLN
ncbi:expressed unknown protein [Seminavis robusta]|uniref:Uncharacterized protein n=1 Tax=Seminavis robusta TaxID=568900 RepID=A0A9N8HW96_9STRA|nr:expressed unknown protein [Seminavis robusta]|eukprot:Sro2161_g317090.1 n/a (419) ;mRNA; f:3062-4318